MFVLYVLYSKGQKAKSQDNEDKEVQIKYREQEKVPVGDRFSAPVHTGPGAHPASYTMGTGFFPPGVKWPGRSVNHPPPSKAEVKETVELYLFSPSGLSWPLRRVKGRHLFLKLS
jgi:hypothetical protein